MGNTNYILDEMNGGGNISSDKQKEFDIQQSADAL